MTTRGARAQAQAQSNAARADEQKADLQRYIAASQAEKNRGKASIAEVATAVAEQKAAVAGAEARVVGFLP